MYIKVKTMDGKDSVMLTVSKMSLIEEVRQLVKDKLNVDPVCQRLFFRGKQMEDGYRLIDYGININDVVQLMVRAIPVPQPIKEVNEEGSEIEETTVDKKEAKKSGDESLTDAICEYYEVQDLIDAKDPFTSSWVEAKIVRIAKNKEDDPLEYHVLFQGHEREIPLPRSFQQIRPRAEELCSNADLKIGEVVLVNYNMEESKERGLWYDGKLTKADLQSRTKKKVIVTLIMGEENETEVNDCSIYFVKEIMRIPQVKKRGDQTAEETRLLKKGPATKRESAPYCHHCNDNPRRKCKFCGCHECGSKENPDQQIMCDECDLPYHLYCLKPPLTCMPDESEEWYCPKCKTDSSQIVKAGEKLKESKKKAKAPSNLNKNTTRDWGRGMACAGRAKECTIVPSNHFGPIPGVDVGTTWRFRFQASEAGVHRPPVGGIHGREKEGAYSIVLSGGYEDDMDNGDSFYYTGSGGRDLTGNKRTAGQSCDQTLTRMNLALALNCNVEVNETNGAEAKDWRKGKPVRVLRKGHADEKSLAKGPSKGKGKAAKHASSYGPEIGVRYDGIYKIVKYWPEKGKSGFLVWRYFLQRDDPTPPVWTEEGKKRIQQLGLDHVIYPEGHLEAMEAKEQEKEKNGGKRKSVVELLQQNKESSTAKKAKKVGYQLEPEIAELIEKDILNRKLWDECKESLDDTKHKFVSKVEERFLCICCQEVVCKPITTSCTHNICLACLQGSFRAKVFTCPSCRHELGKNMAMEPNEDLCRALNAIFPGYENGR